MGASASMDYTQPSGSCVAGSLCYTTGSMLANSFKIPGPVGQMDFQDTIISSSAGQVCNAVYTYYQRVFDDTNIFWCYYSGSAVDPTPGITDTTPNNSGNISGHNIITITSEIVCS